jgi:hypothetical protein
MREYQQHVERRLCVEAVAQLLLESWHSVSPGVAPVRFD